MVEQVLIQISSQIGQILRKVQINCSYEKPRFKLTLILSQIKDTQGNGFNVELLFFKLFKLVSWSTKNKFV